MVTEIMKVRSPFWPLINILLVIALSGPSGFAMGKPAPEPQPAPSVSAAVPFDRVEAGSFDLITPSVTSPYQVAGVQYLKNNSILAIGYSNPSIEFVPAPVEGHNHGQKPVGVGPQGYFSLVDRATHQELRRIQYEDRALLDFRLTRDATKILVQADQGLQVIDAATGTRSHTVHFKDAASGNPIRSFDLLDVSPDDQTAVISAEPGAANQIYFVSLPEVLKSPGFFELGDRELSVSGLEGSYGAVFSNGNRMLVKDGMATFFDAAGNSQKTVKLPRQRWNDRFATTSDGQRIAIAASWISDDPSITLCASDGAVVQKIDLTKLGLPLRAGDALAQISGLRFSRDGQLSFMISLVNSNVSESDNSVVLVVLDTSFKLEQSAYIPFNQGYIATKIVEKN